MLNDARVGKKILLMKFIKLSQKHNKDTRPPLFQKGQNMIVILKGLVFGLLIVAEILNEIDR